MKVFHAERTPVALPEGHRFPMAKYALLRDGLARALPQLDVQPAEAATDGQLALAHEPAYVDAVERGSLAPAQQREIGFPWSPAMASRARRSVGATIAAARAAMVEGVAANLGGGTHHAKAGSGAGYCVFNDVAVAARLMQAEAGARGRSPMRVAVIDLDVHQGDGTASIFRSDASVFTLSLHGARNFPFRKERSSLDVELPDGCTDEPYLRALDDALEALWRHHGGSLPQLVFYLAGADPHEGDRLGRLKLTGDGLAERDRRVFVALYARRIPVVMLMAGGYGRVIEDTVAVQVRSFRAALSCWSCWQSLRTMEQSSA